MFIINSFWFVVDSVMAWCKIIKTGSTVSFRTGDDFDLDNGRDADWLTLGSNNPFGNTNRFTDELGGSTYTNNIVIDWTTYDGSTVLGYSRTPILANTNGWNEAIDNSLTYSVGSFTTGWYCPNIRELSNITSYQNTNSTSTYYKFNYAPFNISSTYIFWSSTTYAISTTQALYIQNTTGFIGSANKTTLTYYYLPCRNFTVTGTTLS